jgi:hypothetical protein
METSPRGSILNPCSPNRILENILSLPANRRFAASLRYIASIYLPAAESCYGPD